LEDTLSKLRDDQLTEVLNAANVVTRDVYFNFTDSGPEKAEALCMQHYGIGYKDFAAKAEAIVDKIKQKLPEELDME
jgi:hypothetical protein